MINPLGTRFLFTLFGVIIVIGLAVYFVNDHFNEYRFRGLEVNRLRGDSTKYHDWVVTLEHLMGRKNDTLARQDKTISGLTSTTATLAATNAKLREDNAEARAVGADLERNAALMAQQKNLAVQKYDALAAKRAADELVGGIGTVPTSLTDVLGNQYYAALKGQVFAYEDKIVPGLSKSIGILTVDKTNAQAAASRNSEVAVRAGQAVANARSYTQNRISFYQKGLRKFTRRRVSKELMAVEDTLSKQQEKLQ